MNGSAIAECCFFVEVFWRNKIFSEEICNFARALSKMMSSFKRRRWHLFLTPVWTQGARWVNGAEIAKWIASVKTELRAIRSTASVCAREVGPAFTATRSVLPTAMGKTAPRSVVAETAEAVITSLASVIALPATPVHCEFLLRFL